MPVEFLLSISKYETLFLASLQLTLALSIFRAPAVFSLCPVVLTGMLVGKAQALQFPAFTLSI